MTLPNLYRILDSAFRRNHKSEQKYDRNNWDYTQGAAENIKSTLESHIQDITKSGLWYGGSSMISPTRSDFGERESPKIRYTTHIIRNINKKDGYDDQKSSVLPKSAMAIVGTTDKVAAHEQPVTLQWQVHVVPSYQWHVPVVPAIVQPSPIKKRYDCFTLQTYFGHGVVK